MKLEDLTVRHRSADVGGIKLHFVEKGTGPLVLLLHGFPEMWWSWRHQIDALASAGFRVVAPDLRGYNESDKQGPYDLDTLAADVRGLIQHLGVSKACVVGHDWGGAIAWHLTATMPHVVERLSVLNCPHPAQMQRVLMSGNLSQLRKSWYMAFFQLPILPERMLTKDNGAAIVRTLRAHAVDRANFSDEELAPMRENIVRPGAATAMLGYYRDMVKGIVKSRGKGQKYPKIEAPTMLVWAKDDAALGYDELVPGTERYVSDLRIEPIERCGHFVQAERPDRVNPLLIDFFAPARDAAKRALEEDDAE